MLHKLIIQRIPKIAHQGLEFPDELQQSLLELKEHTDGIGISTINLLEISRLVNRGRLVLPLPLKEWFSIALAEEGILLIPIES